VVAGDADQEARKNELHVFPGGIQLHSLTQYRTWLPVPMRRKKKKERRHQNKKEKRKDNKTAKMKT
jgi:hypothetical protein